MNTEKSHLPECFSGRLRALLSGDTNAPGSLGGYAQGNDPTRTWISLIVELNDKVDSVGKLQSVAEDSSQAAHDEAGRPVTLRDLWGGRLWDLTLRWDVLLNIVKSPYVANSLGEVASTVDIALPLVPQDVAGKPWATDLDAEERPKTRGELLVGVIDDGCPFAHWRFRGGSCRKTRVRAVWDQNDRPPVAVPNPNGERFGRVPFDYKAGLEFWRKDSDSGTTRIIGLDRWITQHTHAGTVDEDGCYADGGFTRRTDPRGGLTRMAGLYSHGSHVMDLAAGSPPPSSRISTNLAVPPSWAAASEEDPAGTAEVVFVQIPEAGVQDATGQWLQASIIPGIEYIVSCADPAVTRKVVVTISYGPTTGPHDGSSLLEKALRALCNKHNGQNGTVELHIVLPAGNSYLSQAHVEFKGNTGNKPVSWTWRVPPDNPVDSWAEVWVDSTQTTGVKVVLKDPAGNSGPLPQRGPGNEWSLRIPPTKAAAGHPQPAQHGNWTIEVSGVPQGATVHAYLARTDPNLGSRSGAKASRFVDSDWEQNHAARAAHSYANGAFDLSRSLVKTEGTLNGMATGWHPRIHVAGGYVLHRGRRKAPYSSIGQRRPRASVTRPSPDHALPTDETPALAGLPGAGTRGAATFRLVGTSTAAPQLARQLCRPALPNELPPRNPNLPPGHASSDLPAP